MPKSGEEHTGRLNHIRRHNLIIYGGALVRYLYRRERLLRDEHGNENFDIFPADMFFEDNSAGINMLMKATHYEIVPEPLYYYWMNPTSTTHVFNWEKMPDRIRSGFIIKDNAIRYGYYNEFKDEVNANIILCMYLITLHNIMSAGGNDELLKELKTKFLNLVPDDWENNPYLAEIAPVNMRILGKFHMAGHEKIGWYISCIYTPSYLKAFRAIKFLFTDPKTFVIKLKKNLRKLCQK